MVLVLESFRLSIRFLSFIAIFFSFRFIVPSDRIGYAVRPMWFSFSIHTFINCT